MPYDAETIDGKGLVVSRASSTCSFDRPASGAGADRSATGRGRPVDLAEAPLSSTPPDNRRDSRPNSKSAGTLDLTEAVAEPIAGSDLRTSWSAPGGAIAAGQSALVSLSGRPRREVILSAPVFLHVNLAPPTSRRRLPHRLPQLRLPGPPGQFRRRRRSRAPEAGENPYPRMLMGAVAHFRQAMLDSEHLQRLVDDDSHGGAAAVRPGPQGAAARKSCRSGGRRILATRSTAH